MTWNKDKIIELLLEAGEVAKASKKNLRREFKADASIVTQADREIEDLLSRELESPQTGTYIIGEETVDSKGEDYVERALQEECFVIDPIDGTSPYAHGMPHWGVSVGRMEAGVLTDGAVLLPEFGEMVVSDGDSVLGAVLEDGKWVWSQLERQRNPLGDAALVAITQGVAKRGQVHLKNPVQTLGAAVVPLVGMLQGRFLGYLGNVKLWDAAGSLPLILRQGLSAAVTTGEETRSIGPEVTDETYHLEAGSPERWKFRGDLLICHPEDEEKMRGAFIRG